MDIQQTSTGLTGADFLALLFKYNHLIQETPEVTRIINATEAHFKKPPYLPLHIYCDHAPSPRRWHKPGDQTPQAPH